MLKTTILLGALTGLIMLIGGLLDGRGGVEVAFVFALAMNFFSYWFSDKLALRAYRAQPIDAASAPELNSIVNELANEAGIPMPRLYLIDSETPNAFATGRNPRHAAVAVTRGIMRICNREELKGVIGHELSHVRRRHRALPGRWRSSGCGVQESRRWLRSFSRSQLLPRVGKSGAHDRSARQMNRPASS